MNRVKGIPFHPLLFAIYPILALLAHNIEEVDPVTVLRSIVISIIGTTLLLFFFRLIFKDWEKAGLVTSLTLILFFSYGHIYGAVEKLSLTALPLGRHRILVPIFLIVWSLLVWWISRQKGSLRVVTQAASLVGLVVLVFPVFSIGRYMAYAADARASGLVQNSARIGQGDATPDIYYIILDGYSRDDSLKQVYGYDNTAFIKALTDMGFYVARCSQSNYAQTQLSLASSLNMDFLPALDQNYSESPDGSRAGLPGFIRHSAVRKFLEEAGYKTVAFDSGYSWTNITDVDFYLTPYGRSVSTLGMIGRANEFEVMLMETSGALLLTDATLKLPELFKPELGLKKMHRERILYELDQLPKVPSLPGPKFVFAHIGAPHTPYVFGPDGEMVDRNIEGKQGYRDQVTYINKRVIPILQQIIARSQIPPVIIVQGDHGWVAADPPNRMRILNAYYLPGGGDQKIYESISPVNSFRLVLDHYFVGSYDFVKDDSFYSTYQLPFEFTQIIDQRPGCQK